MTKTFRDLGVDAALCDALEAQGIIHPFPIQELTLPLALDGHDLIGQARTGTGKTLAFGLPLLQRLQPDRRKTQALVVVPTRELCLQVHSDLQIGQSTGLTTISVYGGVGYDEQIEALQGGVHVVVGTPGRLLDHLERGNLDLSAVTELVLDEADEMLDMGFLADVERLVEACTAKDRHTMLFSATMPTAIVKLARRYMDHPTFTRAEHEAVDTAPTVEQHFFQVHRLDKPRILARILQSPNRGGVYVFVRTKQMADRLVNDLEDLSVPAIAIHGDLRQSTREKNLDRFRSGKATVLVATEVAARGLDVTGVTHVVNYDCPDDEKMYLHRIGRTARAGEAGVAITFAEFNEADRLNVIRKAVGATDTDVEPIFSTSERLRELFDLPEETPWRRAAGGRGSRTDGGRGNRADGGRSSRTGGGRSSRTGGGRDSSSDGRPKSGRRSEGTGGDHDASRRRGGQPRTQAPTEQRRPVERERTRTRRRTRARTTGPGDDAAAGDRPSPKGRATGTDPDRPSPKGPTTGTDPGRPAADEERADAGRRRDADRERSEAGTTRQTPRDRSAGTGARRRRASSTQGGDASGRDRSGGGTSRRGAARRGGRGGGHGRDGAEDGGRRGDAATAKLARRGADARGAGQPHVNRRVRVEHLP